jgi:hypothetical protein
MVVVVTIEVDVVGAIVVVVVFETNTGVVVVVVVGTADVGGGVVSMTIDNAVLCDEVLPARSVATAVTVQVPSLSVGRSHVVATAVL